MHMILMTEKKAQYISVQSSRNNMLFIDTIQINQRANWRFYSTSVFSNCPICVIRHPVDPWHSSVHKTADSWRSLRQMCCNISTYSSFSRVVYGKLMEEGTSYLLYKFELSYSSNTPLCFLPTKGVPCIWRISLGVEIKLQEWKLSYIYYTWYNIQIITFPFTYKLSKNCFLSVSSMLLAPMGVIYWKTLGYIRSEIIKLSACFYWFYFFNLILFWFGQECNNTYWTQWS